MKAPICEICLRSSILCSACKEKLDTGRITEADVKVSRTVFEASDRFKSLRSVTVKRVIDTPSNTIIITERDDAAKVIGKGGSIVRELTKTLNKNVRVIEETSDRREFIEHLVFPAKVSAVNVLYSEGGEMLKAILDRRPGISEQNLREIVKQVYGQDIIISAE
jgi:transcription antitermination factor NusA-like protein